MITWNKQWFYKVIDQKKKLKTWLSCCVVLLTKKQKLSKNVPAIETKKKCIIWELSKTKKKLLISKTWNKQRLEKNTKKKEKATVPIMLPFNFLVWIWNKFETVIITLVFSWTSFETVPS
jgi:hypothetical protein